MLLFSGLCNERLRLNIKVNKGKCHNQVNISGLLAQRKQIQYTKQIFINENLSAKIIFFSIYLTTSASYLVQYIQSFILHILPRFDIVNIIKCFVQFNDFTRLLHNRNQLTKFKCSAVKFSNKIRFLLSCIIR